MIRHLIPLCLILITLNVHAFGLSPFSPLSPFSIYKPHPNKEEKKTYKCQVMPTSKVPCKAPCSLCYKDSKQIPCNEKDSK